MITAKVLFTVHGYLASFREVVDVESLERPVLQAALNKRIEEFKLNGTLNKIVFVEVSTPAEA